MFAWAEGSPGKRTYIMFIIVYASLNVLIAFYNIYLIYSNSTSGPPYLTWVIAANTAIILFLLIPLLRKGKKLQPNS